MPQHDLPVDVPVPVLAVAGPITLAPRPVSHRVQLPVRAVGQRVTLPAVAVRAAAMGAGPRDSGHAFSQHPLVYGGMAAYAVASIGLMAMHKVGLTSEHFIVLGLVVFAFTVRARPFVWDWLPFLFVGVMFEDLSAVATTLAGSVHAVGPILLERGMLGGQVGTLWLQSHLRGLPFAGLLSALLIIEYLFHFAAPPLCGLWLWLRHRERFGQFVSAYVLVMSVGFIIYLLYPETPPWLASREGLLSHVNRMVVDWLQSVGGGFGRIYAGADPEPNAAMPSLHVSIPVIVACAIFAVKGRRSKVAWLALLYPLTLAFGVVYLGEHYVADALAGIVVGCACWAVAARWAHRAQRPMALPLILVDAAEHLRLTAADAMLDPVVELADEPAVAATA